MLTTSDTTHAFWSRMATRYRELLDKATTEADKANWRKRIAEAEEKANPQSPNQDETPPR